MKKLVLITVFICIALTIVGCRGRGKSPVVQTYLNEMVLKPRLKELRIEEEFGVKKVVLDSEDVLAGCRFTAEVSGAGSGTSGHIKGIYYEQPRGTNTFSVAGIRVLAYEGDNTTLKAIFAGWEEVAIYSSKK